MTLLTPFRCMNPDPKPAVGRRTGIGSQAGDCCYGTGSVHIGDGVDSVDLRVQLTLFKLAASLLGTGTVRFDGFSQLLASYTAFV